MCEQINNPPKNVPSFPCANSCRHISMETVTLLVHLSQVNSKLFSQHPETDPNKVVALHATSCIENMEDSCCSPKCLKGKGSSRTGSDQVQKCDWRPSQVRRGGWRITVF
ncbi:uncharacterized protein PRD47_011401 isoform 1-T2 [Ara ararauna]